MQRADQNRAFGFIMAGGLWALALLRYAWIGTVAWWLIAVGTGFLMAGLVVPSWLGPARAVWMKLAGMLGYVNARILLTVVFVGLITPIALLLRLIGKQPIQLGARGDAASYWRKRNAEEFTAKRMERQF